MQRETGKDSCGLTDQENQKANKRKTNDKRECWSRCRYVGTLTSRNTGLQRHQAVPFVNEVGFMHR